MAQEIPVYVFTGFMDSGKTSLVQETLFENEFGEGAKGVIIMCEDGEKEYDEAKLATVNFKLTGIENEEDFKDFLEQRPVVLRVLHLAAAIVDFNFIIFSVVCGDIYDIKAYRCFIQYIAASCDAEQIRRFRVFINFRV